MRVLLWSELFWPHVGGIELVCAGLVGALRKRGHEFLVVTSLGGAAEAATDSFEGAPVHRFPFHPALSRRDLAGMAAINRQVAALKETFRPEVIHLHTVQPSVFFHLKTRSASAAPSLLTVHAVLPPGFANKGLLGSLFDGVDRVAAVSEAARESVLAIVPGAASKTSVVYSGIAPPEVAPSPLPFDPPRILCVGRLVAGKGFDLAIDAFPAVAARFPGAELVIAGDGPEREALERRAAGRARFTGWVVPERVAELINTATVVVVPSREAESFGLVAAQAGQMGRPVVASAVGGLGEVVEDGATGLLLPDLDAAALAAAIERVLGDPDTARRMGDAARRRVASKFAMDRCADEYETLYMQLARRAATEDKQA